MSLSLGRKKLHCDKYLRQTEHDTKYPGDTDHDLHSVRSAILADRVQDRHAPVDADNDNDVCRQVQSKHLHIDTAALVVQLNQPDLSELLLQFTDYKAFFSVSQNVFVREISRLFVKNTIVYTYLYLCRQHKKEIRKKVKFFHTRYRALGPELNSVYKQSARR